MRLHIEHLQKQFPGSGETGDLIVLRDVSLQLGAGQSAAIMGPSGSGKSTLLNIIGGLDQPSSGKLLVNERDLASASEAELARHRREQVGFIFQLHHLLPQCTVIENVLLPLLAAGRPSSPDRQRAGALLERVGLAERLHHRPAQLSGGERQRAAVARALIRQPALLLADEPTGALDEANADQLMGLLLDLNREERLALLTVTHDAGVALRHERQFRLHAGSLEVLDTLPPS